MNTLEKAKKHLQEVILQSGEITKCPLDDAKLHAAIVDCMYAALSEGADGMTNDECSKAVTKLFEGKLSEKDMFSLVSRIDGIYDVVRTVCYLAEKPNGPFIGTI